MTNHQIPAEALKKIDEATESELYDAEFEGGTWMFDTTTTTETLSDFADSAEQWREHGPCVDGQIAGFPFKSWSEVQARAGEQRRDVSVIDFGEVRAVIFEDVSAYA